MSSSSSSNTLKKKKGKHYNRPDMVPSGMLDAYVDTQASEAAAAASTKPVSTKNKNKKKLEMRRMEEEAKESKSQEKETPQEVVILDSWEDIDPDFEPPKTSPAPPPPAKKEAHTQKHKNKHSKQPSDELTKQTHEANARIMSSLSIQDKETTLTAHNKSNPQPTSQEKKPFTSDAPKNASAPNNLKTSLPSDNDDHTSNKSKEDIKAEREAKKATKAARRAASKGGDAAPQVTPSKAAELASISSESLKSNTETIKSNIEPKRSNAELKAERRAKQEAQRAAKAAAINVKGSEGTEKSKSNTNNNNNKSQAPSSSAVIEKKQLKKKTALPTAEVTPSKSAYRKVMLFSHLPIYERSFRGTLPLVNGDIHPAIIQLGLQMAAGTISGSNARCVSLMHALKALISDYVTPPQKELSRDLEQRLKPYVSFLSGCRALSVSMENALRYVRSKIMKLDEVSISDEEAKEQLLEDIDDFVLVNIVLASKQICLTAREKIKDGDVILTYGHSSLVRSVFLHAAEKGVKFRVIVADSRPKFEGKEMVRHLVCANIKCTYVLISAVPYIMREVSKVIVGASSILANGTVNSRVGTSQVALIAKASNVPVLVCCETYKFSERVQTDSFVLNELGDPNDLVTPGDPLKDWQNNSKLNLLNLSYDITPASLVDAIISEISVIPGTSVPVVLRLKNSDVK
eukprot:TRINITY_DN4504_c0_g1_i2.p2 TRINITY_DN4504_c0_g1~~TRINITY_DN4504_c0_g1_i2.p2  ORF type:complete len:688 (-),score=226.62 TRINITY_DN4504_c0_g1_i2:2154-4217(-)